LGIALACLTAFTLIFALSVRTGVVIPFRWVMLGLFTCVLIFAMIKAQRKNWDRPIFWLVCAAVGVHLSVFIPLLRMYPEFGPIWYVPIVIGEATFFGTTLDLVLGRTNKHGGPTR
jgi:FtsH-binding integral membrane protein